MVRILVTGGAGFIGSHLTPALLRAGFEVRIVDNLSPQIHGPLTSRPSWLDDRSIEFIHGSVTSEKDMRAAVVGVDAVVHLAAETGTGQSMYEIARYNSVNTQGTAVLLDILANDSGHPVQRVLLASSRSVYGEGAYICEVCSLDRRVYPDSRTAKQLAAHRWDHLCESCGAVLTAVRTREDDQVKPASIYGATKFAQEELVRIACSSLGIGYAILRLQNVYGEGQSLNNPYTGILSIFSTRIRRGLPLPIFEDGQETRDFVHVEDVANSLVASLQTETPANRAINVGVGLKTTVMEIASHLSAAFNVSPNLIVTGQYRRGDIRHNWADIGRLRDILGYEPQIGLADGLRRFAAWVESQPLPEDKLDKANAELKVRNLMG